MKHLFCLLLLPLLLTGTGAQARITPFRFAQLTDVHLNPNSEAPTKALMQSIEQINRTDSIDFVLVTGDLTEQGDRATMVKVKHCLDHLRQPYYVCLGNHETTWSESGCTAFSEIFGPEFLEFTHKGVQFLLFNSGPLLKMAYGHVSPGVLHWASERLRSAAAVGMPAIVVTHYPILKGDVDNWSAVTDSLRRPGNVRLFIGGHYHVVRELSYDGMPGLLMRSNLPDKEGRPGYGIYEVSEKEIRAYVQSPGMEKRFIRAYTLQKAVYDPQGHAAEYPDFSDNRRWSRVKEVWTSLSGHGKGTAVYSSAVVSGQCVYVGNDDGQLEAYSLKDGRLLWTFATGKRIVGGPAVDHGIVVVGSADHHVYGVKAHDGTLLWKLKTRGPVLGSISTEKGIAYVGASDSAFRAIDLRTGRVVWEFRGLRGYVMTKPLLLPGKVVFGAWDNTLYCLDRQSGKELWRWTGGLTRMHFSPAQCWPVSSYGQVFICDPQRAMTAIDLNTGGQRWRTFASKVRESIGISKDGRRIYAKTMQDSVVCNNARPKVPHQPEEVWATNVGFGYEIGPCMLLEKGGTVFGSTKEGLVYAIDGRTGRLLWRHKVSGSLVNTVLPLSKSKIVYTDTEGHIGLLQVRKAYK